MFKLSKSEARKNFDGSNGLFEASWKRYRKYLLSDIDNPTCQSDVDDWLHSIASEMVNNGGSRFYIYG
jgi:hypothetical protein